MLSLPVIALTNVLRSWQGRQWREGGHHDLLHPWISLHFKTELAMIRLLCFSVFSQRFLLAFAPLVAPCRAKTAQLRVRVSIRAYFKDSTRCLEQQAGSGQAIVSRKMKTQYTLQQVRQFVHSFFPQQRCLFMAMASAACPAPSLLIRFLLVDDLPSRAMWRSGYVMAGTTDRGAHL